MPGFVEAGFGQLCKRMEVQVRAEVNMVNMDAPI